MKKILNHVIKKNVYFIKKILNVLKKIYMSIYFLLKIVFFLKNVLKNIYSIYFYYFKKYIKNLILKI